MPVPLRHTIKALWLQKQETVEVQKNNVAKMRSII